MKRIVFMLLLLAMVFVGCKNTRQPDTKSPVEIEKEEEKSTKSDVEATDSLSTKPVGLNAPSIKDDALPFWPVQQDFLYTHPTDRKPGGADSPKI